MRLTKSQLRKIIKEEIVNEVSEGKWTVQGQPASRAEAAAELASTDEEEDEAVSAPTKTGRFPKTSDLLGIDLLNRVFAKEAELKVRADREHEWSGDGGPYPTPPLFLKALEAVLGEGEQQ